jgi:ABC-type branched-subunit amino acid transport system ATPase component
MPLFETRDLSKHFFRVSALSGVSLSVEPGELVGIIGPNGSGKTTLFNCVTGVLRPSSGQVRFKGEDITGRTADHVYRRGISRTFQLIQVFPEMTVLENLLMAAQERRGTLIGRLLHRDEAAEHGRAQELLEYLGIAPLRDELASNLSYGQQKLLELVRVLMLDPALILLDEPAAGVNRTLLNELLAAIRQLRDEGRTILLVEHDMKVVMGLCERVFVLDYGELIAEGPPEAIQRDERVIEAYFGR